MPRSPNNREELFPRGHFYSPLPDIKAVLDDPTFGRRPLRGIDLRVAAQLELLGALIPYYKEQPFPEQRTPGRYWLDNDYYAYSDGLFLYAMMRHLAPKRVIEIGSGFSSICMVETSRAYLDDKVELTFIDPHPARLLRLMGDSISKHELICEKVQNVPTDRFSELSSGDLLFIDSSHVVKAQSDAAHILFTLLPLLSKGVYIHIHDIFFPFEYPAAWLRFGRAWNECYAVQAFLQYNQAFSIQLFTDFLLKQERELIELHMPLCAKAPSNPLTIPGSLWLRKDIDPE